MHGSYESNFNIRINFKIINFDINLQNVIAFYNKLYFEFIYIWDLTTTKRLV